LIGDLLLRWKNIGVFEEGELTPSVWEKRFESRSGDLWHIARIR
jgi:hypothetical protein